MGKFEVLNQCEANELTPKKAYRKLYATQKVKKMKTAHFVRVSIRINEHPGITALLAFLLALPIPIGFAKMFLRKKRDEVISDAFPITYGELIDDYLVSGILIDIEAKNEAKIHIRTM